jgi:hypothetical protein
MRFACRRALTVFVDQAPSQLPSRLGGGKSTPLWGTSQSLVVGMFAQQFALAYTERKQNSALPLTEKYKTAGSI